MRALSARPSILPRRTPIAKFSKATPPIISRLIQKHKNCPSNLTVSATCTAMEMAKEGPNHKSLKGSPPIAAAAADLGVQFFGFWITFDLASRSPVEIFAIGGAAAKLQVQARKGHTLTVSEARARAANLGVHFLCLWRESLLTLSTGLPLEFLQLEELLLSYRSVHVVIDARARTDVQEGWFFEHFIGIQF